MINLVNIKMKKIAGFVMLLTLVAVPAVNAKIWRVNNNPGRSCNFTNLTDALRSSQVQKGDTIHIEGSVTPYGKDGQTATNCDTVSKKLVIIGPGYFLSDNPETQHNKESAKVRTIHIAATAAGTIIAGLEQVAPESGFNGYDRAYALPTVRVSTTTTQTTVAHLWGDNPQAYKLRIEADSVVVSHCKLFYVDLFNKNRELTNITITKSMFNPGLICVAGSKTVTNTIISNNFFRNDYSSLLNNSTWYSYPYFYLVIDGRAPISNSAANGNYPTVWNLFSWPMVQPTIQNNTFYNVANLAVRSARLYNNVFFYRNNNTHCFGLPVWPGTAEHDTRNNIIYNGAATSWASPTLQTVALTQYNLSYGNMLNDGNNRYSNVAETSWFASSTTLPANDKSFILAATAPARDVAGGDETKQRGMFGGLSPYILSGLYTIPAVWEITIPNYPTGEVPSTGFEVRVRVKSH